MWIFADSSFDGAGLILFQMVSLFKLALCWNSEPVRSADKHLG